MRMRSRSFRAFTIVELLVVIAIISILLGLLATGLGSAIMGGKKTKELNRLKQVMTAWTLYSGQYEDQLLPGFLDPGVQTAWGVNYRNRAGQNLDQGLAQTYVWRLLPFIDFNYEAVLGYREADEEDVDDSLYEAQDPPVTLPGTLAGVDTLAGAGVALEPGFGYNAYYCGGWWTTVSGTPTLAFGDSSWTDVSGSTIRGRLVARTLGSISKPSEFVAFSASTFLAPGDYHGINDLQPGAAWVVPDRLGPTAVWRIGGATMQDVGGIVMEKPSLLRDPIARLLAPAPTVPMGETGFLQVQASQAVPLARFNEAVAIGMADGSVGSSGLRELKDVRKWIPCANAPDFAHGP